MHKLSNRGFAHHLVIVGIVVCVIIGGVFAMVLKASHDHSTKSSLQTASKTSANQTKIGFSTQSKSSASTATGQSTSNTTTSAASASNTSSSKSTAATSKSSSTSSTTGSGPSPTPPPATQTPLSVLTAIITSLDNGGSADVTTNTVNLPGPITTATGRPLVFNVGGQTYFAYTQESAPNFNTTAAQTADSMAIVTATVSSPSLTQAHLNKANNLVNADSEAVGYSTGGD